MKCEGGNYVKKSLVDKKAGWKQFSGKYRFERRVRSLETSVNGGCLIFEEKIQGLIYIAKKKLGPNKIWSKHLF